MDFGFWISFFDSTLRSATPLLLACLAGLYSERSGVFDIGLEGKILASAFAGAAAGVLIGDAYIALFIAVMVSVFFALIHGVACITFRGNQIVSGVAINFLAAGLTAVIGNALFSMGGRTPQIPEDGRFREFPLFFADRLEGVPVIGPLADVLLNQPSFVYMAFLAVPFTWYVLFRTRFGLRLRAVGENPAAVDTAGISVIRLRYQAVICCGILCGLAGATLSMALNAGFVNNMSAGRGFIALAALIFAKWRPVQAMFACLLFGFLDASEARLQGRELWLVGEVPVQFIQALPYVLVVVLLAGFIGKARAPKAGGVAYVKER
ncbi:simple sugar transport system permease protein [Rubricella aquisinus]|uniref:Simple sugar transport system permease protein n=1 Tax=Rubricella aquisinus TaxID=2028108 RepID=A0A840WKL4_9RHOB|nr:ABC transporter permease [Rubricella aquisinus]MBB5515061.1 simple sugar transport system permease protein [Rubricella aquisinus]